MDILAQFVEKAKQVNGTIIFAEGDEPRTLEAASRLVKDKVCSSIAVALSRDAVESVARKQRLDISGVTIMTPSFEALNDEALAAFINKLKAKGVTEEDARQRALDPLNFSALFVKSGKADGCVAGARSSTADVLRAALHGIGTAPDTKLVSSMFIMLPPPGHPLIKDPVMFADCAVNPDPGAVGLKDIAVASVKTFQSLFPGKEAAVAFLSFSTKGSAEHKMLMKVREAAGATKEFFKNAGDVHVDGELQFDAAAVPSVAAKKSPDSPVAGKANIYIFPDLNSGNICYKTAERLGLFTAVGPVIQGLAKPMNDLSRGCSVENIYQVAAISLLKSR